LNVPTEKVSAIISASRIDQNSIISAGQTDQNSIIGVARTDENLLSAWDEL